MEQLKRFEYTGAVQEYEIPANGLYKLEVFGASGGNGRIISGTQHSCIGGMGGYSCGYVYLETGTVLYIVCGGKGEEAPEPVYDREDEEWVCYNIDGGYNGGGSGHSTAETWNSTMGSGGGATHIASGINRGELKNYENHKSEILIAAGGGGGGFAWCAHPVSLVTNGGNGGGTTAGMPVLVAYDDGDSHDWSYKEELLATQTSGYRFGQGENASAGGGGGWYGGNERGGGSGYTGGVPPVTYKGITYSPETITGNNNGNGAAVITLMNKSTPAVYLGNKEITAIHFGTHDVTDIKIFN